jgi:predicted RNA-binding protein YlqC (UPF0109 family)
VREQLRSDYRVSPDSFAQRVKEYISKRPAGFRLNFFVDEGGQFIGQESKLMLNLQTILSAAAARGSKLLQARKKTAGAMLSGAYVIFRLTSN